MFQCFSLKVSIPVAFALPQFFRGDAETGIVGTPNNLVKDGLQLVESHGGRMEDGRFQMVSKRKHIARAETPVEGKSKITPLTGVKKTSYPSYKGNYRGYKSIHS